MAWANVQQWLDESDLPFKWSIYASAAEDMLFPDVYSHFFDYLYRAARSCIVFGNLPDTFYEPFFAMTLFINGKIAVFRRKNDELVALNCAEASKPDLYYVPSKVLVVNPRFKGESYNLTPGKDCEVIYCTSQDMYRFGVSTGGLYSLISITARLLADNYISLNCAQRNTRLTNALAADDELTQVSIEFVLREMYAGRPYKVVQKTLVDKLENIPLQQTGTNQNLIQLLETHKYILSEFFASIGIDEPQQMKRERLVTAEVEQGAELPMFNIYDIYESIKDGVDRVNAMYGTNITVQINPLIVRALEDGTDAEDPDDMTQEVQDSPGIVMQDEPDPTAEDTSPDVEDEEPEGTAGSDASDPEPEPEEDAPDDGSGDAAIVDNAVEIIEAAADIIEQVAGGDGDAEDSAADQSGDQSEAGEMGRDSDD